MVTEATVRARITDLRRRDRIAAKRLGARGELLDRALDEREAALARRGPPPGAVEVQPFGLLDWWVWNEYGTGTLQNVDRIRLQWVGGAAAAAQLMAYAPDPDAPFSFTDTTGHTITPGVFLTDGGTVPAIATAVSGIDRWSYLPAYLIHDWEYVLKHCDQLPPGRDRNRVDAALLEALKTMMTTGIVPESRRKFWAIETALANFAEEYWSADTPCSLPVA